MSENPSPSGAGFVHGTHFERKTSTVKASLPITQTGAHMTCLNPFLYKLSLYGFRSFVCYVPKFFKFKFKSFIGLTKAVNGRFDKCSFRYH